MSTDFSEQAAGTDWLIVGIGTPASSDDEVGLALVRALSREARYNGRCRILDYPDAATVAFSLLEWRKPVILVDAADMDLAAGEYRFFADTDASMILKNSSVSTHGLGLAEGLKLARTLGFDLPIRIFGVQPFDLSPKQGLTREMSERFPSLLDALKTACSRLRA